jgi:hypothetical protein
VAPRAPWTVWLEAHSLFYAKVIGRVKALRFRRGGPAGSAGSPVAWDSIIDAGASQLARDLASFVAVAGARGIPVVLMTVAHVSGADSAPTSPVIARGWSYAVPGVAPEVILRGYRRYNAAIAEVAAGWGVPLIDGAASGVAGTDRYADDDTIHFNDAGADAFADFVARQLVGGVSCRASQAPRRRDGPRSVRRCP